MTSSTMIHVRVNESIKMQATQALTAMGLTVSDAVRVFLTRIAADQALPFAIKTPNAASRAAIDEAETIIKNRHARFATTDALMDDLEKARSQ